MKKILLIIALPILLFSNTAFGVDVTGVWGVEMDCVRIGAPADGEGLYLTEVGYLVITRQEGDLFNGLSCPAPEPGYVGRKNFYGAIMGKKIYFTHWDSISVGSVNSKGTVISNIVSQNQEDNDPSAPGICIGTAVLLRTEFVPEDPCSPPPAP